MAERQRLEALQVLGDSPGQGVVLPDAAVARDRDDQAEGRTIDGIARRTVSSLTEAERLYTTFVADESRDDSIRLKAAQQLTDLALRLWEARHVLRRLDELERRIDETQ